MEDFITVHEAVDVCHAAGMTDINEQQMRYKLDNGLIKGGRPPEGNPRLGWKVDRASVEECIAAHRADVSQAKEEICFLNEEIEKLRGENRSLREQLNSSQQEPAHVEFILPDIERYIDEEARKIGITYREITDTVHQVILGFANPSVPNALESLVRHLAHFMLLDELRKLFDEGEKGQATNPYFDWSVPNLIAKWKSLRELVGGTPAGGTVATEYSQVEGALAHKGVPSHLFTQFQNRTH